MNLNQSVALHTIPYDHSALPTLARPVHAFARLDLICVIAASLVLGSLAVVAAGRSARLGRSVACLNNLRQIGLALLMYGDDNLACWPERSRTDRWPDRLLPFYRDLSLLLCPEDTKAMTLNNLPYAADRAPRSYFINGWADYYYVTYGQFPQVGKSFPSDAVLEPAGTVTFGEKEPNSSHFYFDFIRPIGNDFNDLDERRHLPETPGTVGGVAMYAFADGHVSFLRCGESLSPTNLWAVVPEYRRF